MTSGFYDVTLVHVDETRAVHVEEMVDRFVACKEGLCRRNENKFENTEKLLDVYSFFQTIN